LKLKKERKTMIINKKESLNQRKNPANKTWTILFKRDDPTRNNIIQTANKEGISIPDFFAKMYDHYSEITEKKSTALMDYVSSTHEMTKENHTAIKEIKSCFERAAATKTIEEKKSWWQR
jgi:hypothetical protein